MSGQEIVAVILLGLTIYVVSGYLVYMIYGDSAPRGDKYDARAILFGLFWPLASVYGIVYLIKNLTDLVKTAFPGREKN